MSRVRNFLTELDDYELAYFAKFKLLTYMKATQLEIQAYLTERNLTESKMEQLIAEHRHATLDDEKERCPRCYSDKIRKDQVEWTDTAGKIGYADEIATLDGLAGRATYTDQAICNVCGFWLSDPNHEKGKSIWKTIWEYLTNDSLGT